MFKSTEWSFRVGRLEMLRLSTAEDRVRVSGPTLENIYLGVGARPVLHHPVDSSAGMGHPWKDRFGPAT